MKLSDWQDKESRPTTPGLYQRDIALAPNSYSYFDGNVWYVFGYSKKEALKVYLYNEVSTIQDDFKWRGVIDD